MAEALREFGERASESTPNLADNWPDRCAHWRAEVDREKPPRRRRQRETAPLIITGEGTSISVDKGALLVREGLTHFPQEKTAHRFFKGDLARPRAIVLVDGSGLISFDALDWMGEQDIALVRLDWTGAVGVVISASGYSADPGRVAWQRETRADPQKRLAFSLDIVRAKLNAAHQTLAGHIEPSESQGRALARIGELRASLDASPPTSATSLLGIEGEAAKTYFAAWRGLPLRWKGTARQPVPDDWRTFTSRMSLRATTKWRNRAATHPMNAMLNYAYAALQARLQVQAIADGYDPTLGVMHSPQLGNPSFVFDRMESLRPVVDAALLKFVGETTFAAADFTIRSDGACRLNPELARRLVQTAGEICG